jgi:DNA primase
MDNGNILELLVEEDFGVKSKPSSRWGKSVDHSSLVIDKQRGIFFWNANNVVGDPVVYLCKVRGYSLHDAKEYLKSFAYSGTHVYTITSKNEEVVVYPKLVEVFFEQGLNNREYFYKRGLTDDTINRFQLGFYNGFSTIPIFENGTLMNFQLRRDKPSKEIRVYYTGLGALLFHSDILKVTDELFWVEGPVDAMVMNQNGLPTVSSSAGGGYKSDWYSRFVRQNKIYILMDNDSAGRNEAIKLAKFLGENRCIIYTFDQFEMSGYDPVDFFRDGHSASDLLELVEKYGKHSFEL